MINFAVKGISATRGFTMMTTTEYVIFTVIWATDAAKGTRAMGGMSA